MKLSIERAALLRSLSHVQSAVEKRNTIPILANVLLRAEEDTLGMSTTDMDLEINETVAANVSEPGTTTVPAHTLHDIIRKFQEGSDVELTLAEGGNIMTVQSGRSVFKLSCLPVTDFPEIGTGEFSANFFTKRGRLARYDRPDEIRNVERGNPLLPERYLCARG